MAIYTSIINGLVGCSPRQLTGETKASDFLISFLEINAIPFKLDRFHTNIPVVKKSYLIADRTPIEHQGCGLVSGIIENADNLASSLIPSVRFEDLPLISFNPKCPAISLANFYFSPAITVSRRDIPNIIRAKSVKGKIEVKIVPHLAKNILIGNHIDPTAIFFAHYDSIGRGAIDNATGVAAVLEAVISNRLILKKDLFVLAANEEISDDRPVYWGRGYRVFEKKYYRLLSRAKRIVVVECVGNSRTKTILNNEKLLRMGFPIKNIRTWSNKITIITGDFDYLMSVYHSDLDDGRGIRVKFLNDAVRTIFRLS